jgi:hypothetical protein
MYAKDVNAQSPLRILERSIRGGLGKGNLGVVMARAGVGKTACLVQIGLDDLMRDRAVLHVALGQTLDHVHSWYEALFDDLAHDSGLDDREEVRTQIGRRRLIEAFGDHRLPPERLEKIVVMLSKALGFKPSAIVVDGWDWSGPTENLRAALIAFKAIAKQCDAELWISAQTHRTQTGTHPTRITLPCEPYADLIDVAIFLEPHGSHVDVRILKDHDAASPPDTHLHLDCDTLRLVAEEEPRASAACVTTPPLPAADRRPRLPSGAFTLLSGGAIGAEAEFGACAESYGMHERTYSFAGRDGVRQRGLVMLSEDELRQGDVSRAYVKSHMHRTYQSVSKELLGSIWHQVSSAGEVFVVGVLQEDGTVKGGTGWAAELAKHWEKTVWVYDQERRGWFVWRDNEWKKTHDPLITRTRFCGTGTRTLSDDGRAAIRGLFERSFAKR